MSEKYKNGAIDLECGIISISGFAAMKKAGIQNF